MKGSSHQVCMHRTAAFPGGAVFVGAHFHDVVVHYSAQAVAQGNVEEGMQQGHIIVPARGGCEASCPAVQQHIMQQTSAGCSRRHQVSRGHGGQPQQC